MRKILALCIALVLWIGPAFADTAHIAKVTEIVDGDTVFIDPPFEDGNEIRLVGIQAPKLPLGRKNFDAWPLSSEAKNLISDLTLGQQITLSFGGSERDRYGRWLAHLHITSGANTGMWVQGEMLRQGLARVYSFADNRSMVDEMLALEHEARQARRGIWAHDYYAIRNADPAILNRELGTFQLIEGRVVDAAKVKGTIYLNFGADWRTDFTVSLRHKTVRMFKKANIDPLTLKGQSIRVRGWLSKRNGPMIKASHPEQIEILGR